MAQAFQDFMRMNPKKSQINNRLQQKIELFEMSKEHKNKIYSKIILYSKEMKFLIKDVENEIDDIGNFQLTGEDILFLKHNTIQYLQLLEQKLIEL